MPSSRQGLYDVMLMRYPSRSVDEEKRRVLVRRATFQAGSYGILRATLRGGSHELRRRGLQGVVYKVD